LRTASTFDFSAPTPNFAKIFPLHFDPLSRIIPPQLAAGEKISRKAEQKAAFAHLTSVYELPILTKGAKNMKPLVLLLSILLIVPGVATAIPDPAAVYCTEQGYEYENGVCIFPDGSECGAWQYYCNCEPNGIGCWQGDFNCGFPCRELSCREAGQFVSIGKCCSGLAEIPRIEAYDDQCNLVGWLGWVFLCSDCGNGICESWESICNCPQDCAPVHNTTQDTYHETIQAAIDNAFDGDTVIVADGTYTGEGNRDIDFLGKAITVRSQHGPENCIIDCNATRWDPHRAFYFHSEEGQDSVVDGFTIINGYMWEGGAILCNRDSNPTISNCRLAHNSGEHLAGAIYCRDSSSTISNCTIWRNSSGELGGGIYCGWGGSPKITNCTITSNSSGDRGGGFACWQSSPIITGCTISDNTAVGKGGAVYCEETHPTINSSTITGNSAYLYGGGIYCDYHTEPTIMNCTITENWADYAGGGIYCNDRRLTITNGILWDNFPDQMYAIADNYPSAVYSNIQDSWAGQGNIDADPRFVEAGYWDMNGVWVEGDYHLLEDSPCVDAGDPNYVPGPNETDLDGNPRVIGGRIDIGAYEYIQPILAEVDINPKTFNLSSKGRWIMCLIRLPEDYNVADIDPNSVLLEDEIEANSLQVNGQVAIVKFSRSEAQDILEAGQLELTVSGELVDGTIFEGTDTITVIDRGGPKPAKYQRPAVGSYKTGAKPHKTN
jgi:predicted outer membrane repeat protein